MGLQCGIRSFSVAFDQAREGVTVHCILLYVYARIIYVTTN